MCYRPASKRTQSNHKGPPPKLQVTPKPVLGVTAKLHCFDFKFV